MQEKLYWTDKNRVPKSDPTSLMDHALSEHDWYFWFITIIGVAWMFSLIVGHMLIAGIVMIPGQQLKRMIK
jgi:hypothetical protein